MKSKEVTSKLVRKTKPVILEYEMKESNEKIISENLVDLMIVIANHFRNTDLSVKEGCNLLRLAAECFENGKDEFMEFMEGKK
jgi:hypothetical protein